MKGLRVTMQRLGQRQAELLLQRKGTAEETAIQNWEHLGKNGLKERGGELWKISGLSRDFQQLLGDRPDGAVGKAQAASHRRCEGPRGRGGNTPCLWGNLPSQDRASAEGWGHPREAREGLRWDKSS